MITFRLFHQFSERIGNLSMNSDIGRETEHVYHSPYKFEAGAKDTL